MFVEVCMWGGGSRVGRGVYVGGGSEVGVLVGVAVGNGV